MSLLLFWQADAPAEVTSTATWSQAAATWAAAASESIPSTASFSQSATWAAQGAESYAATGSWDQTAGWAATGSQQFTSTASWSQDATWSGSGLAANPVDAEATFTQAAASWIAATDQLISGTASFEQAAASWDAVAELANGAAAAFSQAPAAWDATLSEQITATGAWEQSATWQASESNLVTSSGTWEQGASWAASGSLATDTPQSGFASRRQPRFRGAPEIVLVGAQASFGQSPGVWGAVMTVDRAAVDVEELMLAGVL